MKNSVHLWLLLLCLAACQNQPGTSVKAETTNWQLIPAQSTLSFVSTKNKTITEEHSIQFAQGTINQERAFNASIDLSTVDTQIPIRDQRMRDILFETKTYPTAQISASIPTDLDISMDQNVKLPFTLDLHGKQKSYAVEVVIQMADNQLVVVNYEPILVNAKDFSLDDGINQLTQIAGLQSINYEVLVDFKLTFEK